MVYPRDLEHFYSKGYRLDGTQRLDTTCKACDDKRKQEWNKNNRDKKNASTRRSYKKNATKIKLRQKEKRKNDPSLRQYFRQYYQDKLKNDPHHRVRRNVSKSVWEALSGKKKSKPTFEALGYTKEDLVEHLESQFDENMTWDNYGSYWHIDHIYPQSRLPYDSMEHPNFLKCWDLSNLRPLEAIENMSKGNKIINS